MVLKKHFSKLFINHEKPIDCPSVMLQLRIGIVKNPQAASKQWGEGRRLIVARYDAATYTFS